MTRKKVKLVFITNDASRKATYKKRKKGLMKKVSELSTLCGIDACAIIYSPYESQPAVWPNTMGVQRVLSQFKRMPEMEQSKKMVNQESFIRQRIAKANEQLKKQLKENREKELTQVMYQCLTGKSMQNLVMTDLNDLGWLIDVKLKEIYKRMEFLKKRNNQHNNNVDVVVGSEQIETSSSVSNLMDKAKGVMMHDQDEKKPVVDLGIWEQEMQRPCTSSWFNDFNWMNNNVANNEQQQQQHHHLGFGSRGEDMLMMPFGDGQISAMWSSTFYP